MIRPAEASDWSQIWAILKPVFRAGETYAIDCDITEAAAQTLWLDQPVATFVWDAGAVLGSFYLKQNHRGGASHVCNCGYVTAAAAQGQGIARAMCEYSQDVARSHGFGAMQFNLVLASNEGAVALWQKLGFEIVGTLPGAFDHPSHGFVDAHIMWKSL